MFKIGDEVWYAQLKWVEKFVKCPECFGLKYLTVILGDQSEMTIDCAGCAKGYDPPMGYVTYWERVPNVCLIRINRVEIQADKTEYGHSQNYRVEESELFLNREAAEIRAIELAKKENEEEVARIHRKDKNNRTWAWHVYYHRSCIRRAEKDLIYHTAKLAVAKQKAKEDKTQQKAEN